MTITYSSMEKPQIDVRVLSAKIMHAIDEMGFDSRLLTSTTRTREISDLRKIVCNLLFHNTEMTTRQIGKHLHMTHPSVVSAIRRSKELYTTDPNFSEMVGLLLSFIDERVYFVWR